MCACTIAYVNVLCVAQAQHCICEAYAVQLTHRSIDDKLRDSHSLFVVSAWINLDTIPGTTLAVLIELVAS